MRAVVIGVIALLLSTASVFGSGPGPCGDVDDDALDEVSWRDVTVLIDFLFLQGEALPQPQDADVDGKMGITIADFYRLVDNMVGTFAPLDCAGSELYAYTISAEDTVILPLARCIDSGEVSVSLPVEVRMHAAGSRFRLPINVLGNGSNTAFVFAGATSNGEGQVGEGPNGEPVLTGAESQTFTLHYTRSTPGVWGWIATGALDFDAERKFVVVHNVFTDSLDLYRPTALFDYVIDYPPGDMDCDCTETMADLTLLIDRLYISLLPLPSCQ